MAEAAARLTAALADRYRLERELGAGGMATVYLAQDLKHQRRVAIKVLRPELAAAIGADRFLREITTTASLRHPHIVPLRDSGTAGATLFYVMPFVDGESLRGRIGGSNEAWRSHPPRRNLARPPIVDSNRESCPDALPPAARPAGRLVAPDARPGSDRVRGHDAQ